MEIDRYLERVQAVLGGNIVITDELIQLPENSIMAKSFIIKYVPNYLELIGDEKVIFESCIIYQTAINLFEYVQENTMKIEQSVYVKIERFQTQPDKKLANIILKRDKLLSTLSPEYKSMNQYKPYGFLLSSEYVNPNSVL